MRKYKQQFHCKNCNKLTSDVDNEGLCEDCRKPKLLVRNPNGYNAHKKNPTPVAEVLPKPLSKEEQFEKIKALGNQIWRKKRELLSMAHEFKKLQREYFGWEEEE